MECNVENTRWQHFVKEAVRLFLSFLEHCVPLSDNLLQVLRVFLVHSQHLIDQVSLAGSTNVTQWLGADAVLELTKH